jgi:integrase
MTYRADAVAEKGNMQMARKFGQIIAVRENTWMVRIPLGSDPETKKRNYYNRTIHGSFRQAQSFLNRKMNEWGTNRQTDGGKIRLNQFLDQWLKTIKPRVREKTYETYTGLLEKHIRPVLGKKLLVTIKPLDIQTAYTQMTERGLSAATVQHAHWVLHAALRQAVQWEMIVNDPSKGLKLPRIAKREMQVFSVEQAKVFLKAALPTLYGTLFALAVTTGMRPSEYIGLKWQDIDWERGTVSVKRTLGKGSRGWAFGETKREGSRRVIRLQNWVIARLKQLKESRSKKPEIDLEECAEAEDLIFLTEFGKPVNLNSLAYKHFKPILKRVGLPEIRLYDLRHTAATLALTVGVSPKVVSEQLGHSSAAFTLDVYSHVLPHMQDDAAAKVEAALMGGTQV